MKHAPLFITGTGTGVGKTVLAALLVGYLRQTGVSVVPCKPVCSGGRDDAGRLAEALGGELTLDEINPWHFREPIAPVLAARRERQRVTLPEIVAHARTLRKLGDVLLIEGAGGLLSPLGEGVDSRDVIAALRAVPVIVGANRLGVINHLRLTLTALPVVARAKAIIVMMSPEKADASTRTNVALLRDYFDRKKIVELPWLGQPLDFKKALRSGRVQKPLAQIARLARF